MQSRRACVCVAAGERVSDGRGGTELEALSTSKHRDVRFRALYVRNKLEQDQRIFAAPDMEEIPVAAGETSRGRRALIKSKRAGEMCFFFFLTQERK